MKNGIYITTENIFDLNNNSNGVKKKINDQIITLNITEELTCKSYVLPVHNSNSFIKLFSYLFFDTYKKLNLDFSIYDFIYIRRISPVNRSFINLLKNIKKKNIKCKILYELPTYPYDTEHITLRSKINLFIDKLFRNKLKYYIDRIITLSVDNMIFGIPTIRYKNGILSSNIKVRNPKESDKNIHFVIVAQFMIWHGYDRLIEGLKNYYDQKNTIKVCLHFVGDGNELYNYINLTEKLKLSEYVVFHGLLFDDKLTEMFDNSDIAVCSLGNHKMGIYLSSELKSREYLARGIPMVSSTKIDVLPDGFKYCFYVPEDDSPVDIKAIVEYFEKLKKEKNIIEVIKEIRSFAEKYCDVSITMKPIIDFLLN